MKLINEQIQILKDGKIEDNKFYLQGQLDRKQYKSINEVLETIGLKWNRKEKAHIIEGFSENDLKTSIDDICENGEVETLKETIKKFQFYPTPKEVAEYLIKLADLKPLDDVLEPSAGQGAIVDEILKQKFRDLKLIELKEENFNILFDKYNLQRKPGEYGEKLIEIKQEDFLNMKYHFLTEKIIMNPPFSKSQDVKHILKAYTHLREGGRIVSIASASIKTRTGKLYDELKELNPEFIELPEGSFKESGTMVNSIIVIINK